MNAVLAIVDPPKAEIGKVYMGRVVNITKFGAFINILPGRDGLVHISKLGGGKRINSVEDVLELGQEFEVKVEEIDDRGKVSLVPAGDLPEASSGSGDSDGGRAPAPARSNDRQERPERQERSSGNGSSTDVETVSFEEAFDAELAGELGDLGPADEKRSDAGRGRGGDRGDRGARRRHR
jgi:polyribonucleotide nucleotidyltransferase